MAENTKLRHDDDDHPLLLISDRGMDDDDDKHYLYSITENRFRQLAIAPELDDMDVLGSAFGWIVLAHPKDDYCYMWNPSSMENIELGQLKYSFTYNRCVMSKSPSEPGYCHVMFYATFGLIPSHSLLLDGEYVESRNDFDNGGIGVMAAASFRGKIYCIVDTPKDCFVIVDFDGNTLKYTPLLLKVDMGEPWVLPDPNPDWLWCTEFHLIKSSSWGLKDELLLVKKLRTCDFLSNELDFKVFRVDVDGRECVELETIGDRAIFLSDHGGSFCCSTTSSSSSSRGILYRRNCVYYTLLNNESRCVYVFDLDDRSTTPLLPCPAARRSRTTSNWIENVIATISS